MTEPILIDPSEHKLIELPTRNLLLGGTFNIQNFDRFGYPKWIEKDRKNAATNEGLNNILDVAFHGGTPIGTWYILLIDNAGFTSLDATDTLASHGNWTEFTNYTGNRQEWVEGAPSGQSIANPSSTDFSILGTGTINGVGLCSVATLTGGILWATASFGSPQGVDNGDTLRVTYQVNAAAA